VAKVTNLLDQQQALTFLFLTQKSNKLRKFKDIFGYCVFLMTIAMQTRHQEKFEFNCFASQALI